MNVVKTFEQRMNDIFGASSQALSAPISFKRLAKRTTREMEGETYVVDGVTTAPALYTILVSAADDAAMRSLYPEITSELADCISAEATRKGYGFVGEPLTRFMVDPSLRSGKFAVFAENVDRRTLEHLRHEEAAFLSGASVVGGAATSAGKAHGVEISRRNKHGHRRAATMPDVATMPVVEPTPAPVYAEPDEVAQPAPASASHYGQSGEWTAGDDAYGQSPAAPVAADPYAAQSPAAQVNPVSQLSSEHQREIPVPNPVAIPVTSSSLADDSVGLGVIPADYLADQYVSSPAPEPLTIPQISYDDSYVAPVVDPARAATAVPVTQRRVAAQPAPTAAPANPTCRLINHQSGEVFNVTTTQVILGRERAEGAVVLRDPNVSRRHALLSFDGRIWRIQDLQSTNGTLVNDIDINECALHDGDLITIGLMNLEFREG